MALFLARTKDLDQVAELVNQAYRGVAAPDWTSEVGLIDGPRTNRAALADTLKNDAAIILLAKDGAADELCGCVALSPMANAQWYLSMLAVSPQFQAAGLGKSIVAGAENYAHSAGAQSLKISVINLREKLIAWYERLGFVKTGETEPFPYDDPSVGTPLRQDLALVTLTKTLG